MAIPMPRIINPEDDSDYVVEVRILLGITSNELSDAELKTDIVLGMAEREIARSYVENWIAVHNGNDDMAKAALRAAVIIKVALNIISTPAIQNLLIDQTRLIDVIITAKKVPLEELRANLDSLLSQQLVIVGVSRAEGYPEHVAIGKTDNLQIYKYAVTEDGDVVE